MPFTRISPPKELEKIIECYWIIENDDPSPVVEKIIPDGFAELIFHYGDHYLVQLQDQWQQQAKNLYAGQITRFFYVKNSGISNVLGVKLKPTAMANLFKIPAHLYTDQVVDLSEIPQIKSTPFQKDKHDIVSPAEKIRMLNEYFRNFISAACDTRADEAVELISKARGMISVNDLCSSLFVSERQLERIFRQLIGVSPKFYCRIIRFNYIFQCIQNKDNSWIDIAYNSGYYDQSHFIRNFKAFTGEEPSAYLFDEVNLANFFLLHKTT